MSTALRFCFKVFRLTLLHCRYVSLECTCRSTSRSRARVGQKFRGCHLICIARVKSGCCLELVVMAAETYSSQVDLYISCKGLLNMDITSKSDPLVSLQLHDRHDVTRQWNEARILSPTYCTDMPSDMAVCTGWKDRESGEQLGPVICHTHQGHVSLRGSAETGVSCL